MSKFFKNVLKKNRTSADSAELRKGAAVLQPIDSDEASLSAAATSTDTLTTNQAQAAIKFDNGIQVFFEPTVAAFDVLFIHGLGGHWRDTWRNAQEDQPWPQAWLPNKLKNARLLSWGFDSHVADWIRIVSQNTITDHANNLLRDLSNYRDEDGSDSRPILFVAHSLGGLICEDALLRSRNSPDEHIQQVILCTKGLLFLGTPHSGTNALASWAKGLATTLGLIKQTNPEILEVLRRNSELLYRIQTEFHTMIRDRARKNEHEIGIVCFFEEMAMPGFGVIVTRESATIPTYRSTGIAYNHSDMTKFRANNDPAFLAVAAELRRWSKDLHPLTDRPSSNDARSSTQDMMEINQWSNCFPTIPNFPHNRNDSFVGCSGILEKIENLFCTRSSVALNGIGGAGKTEIATEYCYRIWGRNPSTSVIWIPCDDMVQITLAFNGLASTIELPGHNDPTVDKIQLVSRYLCSGTAPPWFMVLDNFDDSDLLTSEQCQLANVIPKYCGGQVLITTRDSHVAQILTGSSNYCLTIDRLEKTDALALFRSKLPVKTMLDESKELQILEILEYLPLCITQAAAYVDRSTISLEEYLLELTESEKSLLEALNEDQVDMRRGTRSPNSVLRTWKLSFDKIRSRYTQAGDLLCTMAFLDRHNITREMLLGAVESRHQLNKALGTLQGFCLIATELSKDAFRLHRLVQLATRFWLFTKSTDYQISALRLVAASLGASDDDDGRQQALLLPHAKVVEKYTFSAREDNIVLSHVQYAIAKLEFNAGRYDAAAESCWGALLKQRELLGDSDLDTIHSSGLMGVVRRYQGRYADALTLQQDTLGQRNTLLGPDNLDTIRTAQDLADVLERQGDFANAQTHAQRAYSGREDQLGPLHPDTLQSQLHLALLLRRRAKYKDAEAWGRDALKKYIRALSPQHEASLRAAYALAGTLRETGQCAEAVDLSEKVLEGRTRIFGHDHPQTLLAANNLALGYRLQGKLEKAELLYRDVCATHEKTAQRDSPDLLQACQNLAVVLREQGKYAEAETVGRYTLARREQLLGAEHLSTMNTMTDLAMTLVLAGQYLEGEGLAIRALAVRMKRLGPEHTYTLETMFTLALAKEKVGSREEALNLYREVAQGRKSVLGESHRDTKAVYMRLEALSKNAVVEKLPLLTKSTQ